MFIVLQSLVHILTLKNGAENFMWKSKVNGSMIFAISSQIRLCLVIFAKKTDELNEKA